MRNIYFLIVFTFFSCKQENDIKIDENKIVAYGTEQFVLWQGSKKIKLNQAYDIHLKYLLNKNIKTSLEHIKTYPLSYCYDNFYVFSSVTNIHKFGVFNLSGLWVDANSGEINFIDIPSTESFDTGGFIWKYYTK